MITDLQLMERVGCQPPEADINDFVEAGLANPEETLTQAGKILSIAPDEASSLIRLGLELGRYEALSREEVLNA